MHHLTSSTGKWTCPGIYSLDLEGFSLKRSQVTWQTVVCFKKEVFTHEGISMTWLSSKILHSSSHKSLKYLTWAWTRRISARWWNNRFRLDCQRIGLLWRECTRERIQFLSWINNQARICNLKILALALVIAIQSCWCHRSALWIETQQTKWCQVSLKPKRVITSKTALTTLQMTLASTLTLGMSQRWP